MHVVVDAFGVRPGSAAITVENLLRGWSELGTDTISVLTETPPCFEVPPEAATHVVEPPLPGSAGQLWLRSVGVRLAARRLGADAVVSALPASGLVGTGCPRGVIVYDLRHELRPHQFSWVRRLSRKASWGWAFGLADALYCISYRTRDDLVRWRPRVASKAVAARYGSDHVDGWPPPVERDMLPGYALAFGHFANKNVDAVLEAWREFCRSNDRMVLRLIGMSATDRADAERRVRELKISDRVELMPWLDDEQFQRCFVGASLVVFPSDFEGFGLPAVEALRLRIPLVVSGDEALAEVTGGNAATARDTSPARLAQAMREALALTEAQLDAGRQFTEQFKWRSMAATIRDDLAQR